MALELLDSQYVDKNVRSLAVTTLKDLSNDKLLAYLLQLTQVRTDAACVVSETLNI